jgi:hypothetical protein
MVPSVCSSRLRSSCLTLTLSSVASEVAFDEFCTARTQLVRALLVRDPGIALSSAPLNCGKYDDDADEPQEQAKERMDEA